MAFESLAHTAQHHFSEFDGNGVAELPHVLRPTTLENILVGKRLEAAGLAHREIPHVTIQVTQHILAAGDAVVSGFKRLRGFVERAARVASIRACAGLQNVVRKSRASFGERWLAQVRDCIADCAPRHPPNGLLD